MEKTVSSGYWSCRDMAIAEIHNERNRQVELQLDGKFTHTLSDDGMTDYGRVTAIMEEVGEVSRACLVRAGEATDDIDASDAALRKELSQIAALSLAWMERLFGEDGR